VQLARSGEIALFSQLDDLRHLRRRGVGRHRDQATAANRHYRHGDRIVTAQQDEITWRGGDDLHHLRNVTRRFLDADDPGAQVRQTRDRLRLEVDAGPARHVVENDRQRRAVRNLLEVPEETLLRRLVVVGRDRQKAIAPDALEIANELGHLVGVVAAGPSQHRHLVIDLFDNQLDDAALFGAAERRRLAGRANG
jgi:hypothetical protein